MVQDTAVADWWVWSPFGDHTLWCGLSNSAIFTDL